MVDEGSADGGSRGVRYEHLLAEAVPEIYRANAFRVTQLPVNATQREVSRRVDKIRMAEKIGVAAELNDKVMPLVPSPDSDALRQAVQRLRDPEKRLLDEVFWFWPLEDGDGTDAGLGALRTQGEKAAAEVWGAATGEDGRRGALAHHNLAILCHVEALDAEHEERLGNLNDASRQTLPALWDTVFQRWAELRKNGAFWDALRERVAETNDPRLNDSTVANIRKTLPEALAVVSARLAVADFDAGLTDACRRLLSSLWESGLPQADIKRAVRAALDPVRARLRASGESCEKRPEGAPREILLAAGRFLEQTERLLLLIDMALPEGDATRTGVRDDVAMTLLGMLIDYVNASEDWQGALPWLERAAKIAEGETAQHRVSENLAIVHENAEAKAARDRAARSRAAAYATSRVQAPQMKKRRSSRLHRGGIVIVVLIGLGLAGAAMKDGFDGSGSSSSSSTSTLDLSTPTAPANGSASSVNYGAIAKKIGAMVKYNNGLPQDVTGPKPSVATKYLMYVGAFETWKALNDPDKETKRLCDKASNLARSAAAWYKDPYSHSAWSRWNASIHSFNLAWRHWRKTH